MKVKDGFKFGLGFAMAGFVVNAASYIIQIVIMAMVKGSP